MNETEALFVEVYRPRDHGQLAIIKQILDSHGIVHYVNNEYGSVGYIGPVRHLQMVVMVEGKCAAQSQKLLKEYIG